MMVKTKFLLVKSTVLNVNSPVLLVNVLNFTGYIPTFAEFLPKRMNSLDLLQLVRKLGCSAPRATSGCLGCRR